MDWKHWTCDAASDLQVNNDIDNCAILMCCYGRCVCEGLPCSFPVHDMEHIRRQMIEEVLKCQLRELQLPACQVCVLFKFASEVI